MTVTRHRGNGEVRTFPIQYTPLMDATATVGGAPTAVQSQTPASVTFATAPTADAEVVINHTSVGFPITYEELGLEGESWDINLTGAAIRAAYEDPSAFGTTVSVTGWRLPGTAAARLSADSMTGPRLVRQQDGTFAWAPHNWLLSSEDLNSASWTRRGTFSAGTVEVRSGVRCQLCSIGAFGSADAFQALAGPAEGSTQAPAFWLERVSTTGELIAANPNGSAGEWRINLSVLGSGMQRITASHPAVTVISGWTRPIGGVTGLFFYTGGATLQVYVGQMQLNLGPTATAYVPTTTAARFAPPVEWDGAAWGVRSEPAGTNHIRGSAMTGAVSGVLGSGGALPSFWTADAAGMTVEVTTGRTLLGLPAIDVRFTGVPTNGYAALNIDQGLTAGTTGQVWAASVFAQLVAGSLPVGALAQEYVGEWDSVPTFLRQSAVGERTAAEINTPVRIGGATTLGASTAGLRTYFSIVTLGTVVSRDFTIRIAAPQLERDQVTSPIPTFGAAVTRTADDIRLPDEMGGEGTIIVEWVPQAPGDASLPILLGHSTSSTASLFVYDSQQLAHWNGVQDIIAAGLVAVGARNAVGFGWSAAGRSITLNGGSAVADANAVGITDTMRIGAAGNGSQPWASRLRTLRLLRRRLPNARLQALTA